MILVIINYPHHYDHSCSQVAIPAENDVIDLTVTAQQGFGARRPKPKKKYAGNFFCFVSILFVLLCSCLGARMLNPKEKYIAVLWQGACPKSDTMLNGDSSPK